MDSFYRKTQSMKENFEIWMQEMDKIFEIIKQFSYHFDKHIQKLHELIYSLLEQNDVDEMVLPPVDNSIWKRYESAEDVKEIKKNFLLLENWDEQEMGRIVNSTPPKVNDGLPQFGFIEAFKQQNQTFTKVMEQGQETNENIRNMFNQMFELILNKKRQMEDSTNKDTHQLQASTLLKENS